MSLSQAASFLENLLNEQGSSTAPIQTVSTYTCRVCGFVAKSSDTLKSHTEKRHSTFVTPLPYKPHLFKCQQCMFVNRDQDLFNKHRQEVHPGDYQCTICDSVLNNRDNYYRHLNTHTQSHTRLRNMSQSL